MLYFNLTYAVHALNLDIAAEMLLFLNAIYRS